MDHMLTAPGVVKRELDGALCYKISWMGTLPSTMVLTIWGTKCSLEKEGGGDKEEAQAKWN